MEQSQIQCQWSLMYHLAIGFRFTRSISSVLKAILFMVVNASL